MKEAAPRLHRNKLATALANKLARISWSVLRNGRSFDTHGEALAIQQPPNQFATEQAWNGFNMRTLSLVALLAAERPIC